MDRVRADEALLRRTEAVLAQRSAQMAARTARRIPVHAVRRLAFVVTALMLTVGLSVGGYAYWTTPVAWLDVDINPSVELSINALNRVIEATGVNEDGRNVLAELSLAGRPVDRAVARLVEKATAGGFVPDGAVVSLTTLTEKGEPAPRVADAARKGTDEALAATDAQAEVVEDSASVALRDQAAASGYDITPGKYNLIRKMMREAGVELDDAADPQAAITSYFREQFGQDADPSNVSVAGIMLQTKENRKGGTDKSNNGNASGKDRKEPTVSSPVATEPEESTGADPGNNGKHKGNDKGNAGKGNTNRQDDGQPAISASAAPSESAGTATPEPDASGADDAADDAEEAVDNGKTNQGGSSDAKGNGKAVGRDSDKDDGADNGKSDGADSGKADGTDSGNGKGKGK